jgi:hypothetical protein
MALGLGLLMAALAGCARPKAVVTPPAEPQPRIVIETSKPKGALATAKQPGRRSVLMIEGATAAEVGVVFYPGARVTKSQVANTNGGVTAGAELTTTDDYQKVVDFYRQRYQCPELRVKVTDTRGGKLTLLNWQDLKGNYTVGVKRDDQAKRTVITLAKVAAPRRPRHQPTRR